MLWWSEWWSSGRGTQLSDRGGHNSILEQDMFLAGHSGVTTWATAWCSACRRRRQHGAGSTPHPAAAQPARATAWCCACKRRRQHGTGSTPLPAAAQPARPSAGPDCVIGAGQKWAAGHLPQPASGRERLHLITDLGPIPGRGVVSAIISAGSTRAYAGRAGRSLPGHQAYALQWLAHGPSPSIYHSISSSPTYYWSSYWAGVSLKPCPSSIRTLDCSWTLVQLGPLSACTLL